MLERIVPLSMKSQKIINAQQYISIDGKTIISGSDNYHKNDVTNCRSAVREKAL